MADDISRIQRTVNQLMLENQLTDDSSADSESGREHTQQYTGATSRIGIYVEEMRESGIGGRSDEPGAQPKQGMVYHR